MTVTASLLVAQRALKQRRASAASIKNNIAGTFCRKANRTVSLASLAVFNRGIVGISVQHNCDRPDERRDAKAHFEVF